MTLPLLYDRWGADETPLAGVAKLADLKRKLSTLEATAADQVKQEDTSDNIKARKWPLLAEEYRRYGRQMIVPQIGLQG